MWGMLSTSHKPGCRSHARLNAVRLAILYVIMTSVPNVTDNMPSGVVAERLVSELEAELNIQPSNEAKTEVFETPRPRV